MKIAKNIFMGFNTSMNITNYQNTQNFGSIELTRNEAKKLTKMFARYNKDKSPDVYKDLVELFGPKIEKEATQKFGESDKKKDYIQDMYVYLIENFSNMKDNYHPTTNLINRMKNSAIKEAEEVKKAKEIIPLEEMTEKEHLKFSCKQELDCEETDKEIVDKLVKNTKSLSWRERKFLFYYRNEEKLKDIGATYNLVVSSVRNILNKTVHKMKKNFDPEYREKYLFFENPPFIGWKL